MEPAKTNQGISLDGSRILMSVANSSYHVGWFQFPGFHLYYPAREQMAPKLRVFIDHLRAEMHDR